MRLLFIAAAFAASLTAAAAPARAACTVSVSETRVSGCTLYEFIDSWVPSNAGSSDLLVGLNFFLGVDPDEGAYAEPGETWLARVEKSSTGGYLGFGIYLTSGEWVLNRGTYTVAVPLADAGAGLPALAAALAAGWVVRRRAAAARGVRAAGLR